MIFLGLKRKSMKGSLYVEISDSENLTVKMKTLVLEIRKRNLYIYLSHVIE